MFARLRFLTAGESHGPKLTTILEGIPAGLPLAPADINTDLARRQEGFGRGGRMKMEKDTVCITSGAVAGKTTGSPIAMEITNLDYKNWATKEIPPMTTPRPGHADLVGALKFAHADLRLSLERASARETAARVCVGAVCRQLLHQFGVRISSRTIQIGQVTQMDLAEDEIYRAMKDKDTLGGIFEVTAENLPIGLGSYTHWDKRLDGQIAMVMLSIPAMKGVEIGNAFENAKKRGTEVHDEIFRDESGNLIRKTNRAGGLEGGVTNGLPIVVRVAMKPISTTLNPLMSVDLATGIGSPTTYERSDFCAVQRALPISEAMLAYVLANALLEKLGGDSLNEMMPRFESLKKARIADMSLNNQPWRFDYGV